MKSALATLNSDSLGELASMLSRTRTFSKQTWPRYSPRTTAPLRLGYAVSKPMPPSPRNSLPTHLEQFFLHGMDATTSCSSKLERLLISLGGWNPSMRRTPQSGLTIVQFLQSIWSRNRWVGADDVAGQ